MGHRLYSRTLNFCFLPALILIDFFANSFLPDDASWCAPDKPWKPAAARCLPAVCYFLKGMPSNRSSSLPSSSVFAVVTMLMFIPFTLSTLS